MAPVLVPNLGLYFDRPPISAPARGLVDGNNFRIKEGRISTLNLGWDRFGSFQLDGPTTLIDNFFDRTGNQFLIFGTPQDLYHFQQSTETVLFLTPRHETGTVDVTNGSAIVAGTGTSWSTELKAGDFFHAGATGQRDPTAVWYEIDTVDSDTQITLTTNYGEATQTGIDYTARLTFTAEADEQWDTATFFHADPGDEDLWFATNGIDDVVKWDGVADQVTSLSLGFSPITLNTYKNMLIAGNILTDAGDARVTEIRNSDVGRPEDFSGGLASAFKVHGGTDEVLALAAMGDNLVIFANRHLVVADFVGDPFVFTFRQAAEGIGVVGGGLVANFGDFHEFIGSDTKYSFDGVTVVEQGGHVWRDVLRRRDPDRSSMGYAHFDEENGDLIWVLPLGSDPGSGEGDPVSPSEAFPEHYLERSDEEGEFPVPVSHRDFPFTATGFFERQETLTWDQMTQTWEEVNFRWNDQFFLAAFPFNLAGDDQGRVFVLNVSQTADGTALPNFVRFPRRTLSTAREMFGRERNLLSRVYPFAIQFVGRTLQVRPHFAGSVSGPLSLAGTFSLDLGLPEDGHFVSVFRVGRFVELEFASDAGQGWELAGYDIDVRKGGMR